MNQQEIHDRIKAFSSERVEAMRAAGAKIDAVHDAERKRLQAECGAVGHVITQGDGLINWLHQTGECAICGIDDPAAAAKDALAHNLTRG